MYVVPALQVKPELVTAKIAFPFPLENIPVEESVGANKDNPVGE